MLTYIFNILILIISISPQFNNLSLFKNEINSSLIEIGKIKYFLRNNI